MEQVNPNSTVLSIDEEAENLQVVDFIQTWKLKRSLPEPHLPGEPGRAREPRRARTGL
ncbi:MAG: hypothetical protein LBT40_15795 [Deltaproteobacteria bacterium]|nr:hypothetical protein [Deltaproteobacteria bacterium]